MGAATSLTTEHRASCEEGHQGGTREVRGPGSRSQQPRSNSTQVWLGLWKLFTTASALPSGAQSILFRRTD